MLRLVKRFQPLLGNSNFIRSIPPRVFSSGDGVSSVARATSSDPKNDNEDERQRLIVEISKKLRGPLADENGKIPTGAARPVAIEVDGPSHFYVNTTKYTAYTKLKHRLLTRMGYKVLHVPYFEWRKLRGPKAREEYMRGKLLEEPTEWLDESDAKFYKERLSALESELKGVTSPKPPKPPSTPRPEKD